MDPTTGIAVVFGVQVAPARDVEVYKVSIELENTLYQGLNVVVWLTWNMEITITLSKCRRKLDWIRPSLPETGPLAVTTKVWKVPLQCGLPAWFLLENWEELSTVVDWYYRQWNMLMRTRKPRQWKTYRHRAPATARALKLPHPREMSVLNNEYVCFSCTWETDTKTTTQKTQDVTSKRSDRGLDKQSQVGAIKCLISSLAVPSPSTAIFKFLLSFSLLIERD